MQRIKARDLKPGMLVDLEPAFRAFPEGDDAQELADNVHWSIYELAAVEYVHDRGDHVSVEHDYGFIALPVDFEVEVEPLADPLPDAEVE